MKFQYYTLGVTIRGIWRKTKTNKKTNERHFKGKSFVWKTGSIKTFSSTFIWCYSWKMCFWSRIALHSQIRSQNRSSWRLVTWKDHMRKKKRGKKTPQNINVSMCKKKTQQIANIFWVNLNNLRAIQQYHFCWLTSSASLYFNCSRPKIYSIDTVGLIIRFFQNYCHCFRLGVLLSPVLSGVRKIIHCWFRFFQIRNE